LKVGGIWRSEVKERDKDGGGGGEINKKVH